MELITLVVLLALASMVVYFFIPFGFKIKLLGAFIIFFSGYTLFIAPQLVKTLDTMSAPKAYFTWNLFYISTFVLFVFLVIGSLPFLETYYGSPWEKIRFGIGAWLFLAVLDVITPPYVVNPSTCKAVTLDSGWKSTLDATLYTIYGSKLPETSFNLFGRDICTQYLGIYFFGFLFLLVVAILLLTPTEIRQKIMGI